MDTYKMRELIIDAMGESYLIDNIEEYIGKRIIEGCYRYIINTYGIEIEIEESESDEM